MSADEDDDEVVSAAAHAFFVSLEQRLKIEPGSPRAVRAAEWLERHVTMVAELEAQYGPLGRVSTEPLFQFVARQIGSVMAGDQVDPLEERIQLAKILGIFDRLPSN